MSLLLANRAVQEIIGGSPYPPILEDGNTVAWYIADDLSTITKDGSDLVSEWRDKLGSGHDLLQATGADQPLWSSTGILFDGVSEFMSASFALTQPEQIYIVFNQKTWTNNATVFDGYGVLTGLLQQRDLTPNIRVWAGAASGQSSGLALDTFGIIRVLFSGASSKFIVNETTPITGNFGTAQMIGFALGARNNATFFGNVEVKEVIIRKIADSPGDETDIYDYLATKHSI